MIIIYLKGLQKHTNRRQHNSNRMNPNKVMSKSAKLVAILEKVATILDFQRLTYLDLMKASKYLFMPIIMVLMQIINYGNF